MSIWITGSSGMLGSALADECKRLGLDRLCTDAEVDITDSLALREFAEGKPIEWIVNCAAYTAVDKAEEEIDLAFRINATGPGNLAKAAARLGARLIHISTDYVFDGTKGSPYEPDDAPNPTSAYGRSKLEGERKVFAANPDAAIIRTAWLYGGGSPNFVTTMLRLFGGRSEVKVVNDQLGSPTLAIDLARAIAAIIASGKEARGVNHFTNAGETTWFDFATAIRDLASEAGMLGREVKLTPIATSDYPTPAARPPYSVLDCGRIEREFGVERRPWRQALAEHLAGMAEASR